MRKCGQAAVSLSARGEQPVCLWPAAEWATIGAPRVRSCQDVSRADRDHGSTKVGVPNESIGGADWPCAGRDVLRLSNSSVGEAQCARRALHRQRRAERARSNPGRMRSE